MSENTRGRGKQSGSTAAAALSVTAALLSLVSPYAQAGPEGGQVVSGSGSISASGSAGQTTTTINQASDKLSINWQSFNVARAETVNFVQPSASALAVNRIFDTQGSQILGKINANGQVWLINPNGVLFGRDAQINVGGLLASTLNPDDASIGSTRSNFSGNSTASVVNLGQINTTQGGYVAMLGHSVSNQGSINAPGGTVAMGAGSAVSLNFAGSKLLGLEVTSNQVNALAENGGLIQADGGQVFLTAGARESLLASVVNSTGVIRADTAFEHNGKIVLSGGGSGVARLAGALSATGTAAGQTGGTVQVLGDKVLLAPGASIDASGHSGGGTVLVGGDYQGSNASVQNASRVYVASDTSLKADATGDGNGGKVVVWADGDTRFAGSISARGGAQGGNGGFVEVSGKEHLDMQGHIDVAAPHGTGGNVLLDPENIVLSTAANNPGAVTDKTLGTPDLAFADDPDTGTYTVDISTVTGFNELFLQATNNITVSNTVTMGAGNSIRLEANNNIAVNAGITVTGAGSIKLTANADNIGTGTLSLAAALRAQAGGISLSGASITSTAAGTLTSTGADGADAGNISLTASGNVNLLGAITANGGNTTSVGRKAGNVTITAQTGITTAAITASGTAGAAGNNNGGAAGAISLTNNTSGNISTGALTSQTGNATGMGAGGTAGSISVTNNASGGNVTTAALNTTGGTKGAGGHITVSAAGAGELKTNGTAITSLGGGGSSSAGANAGNITLSGGTVTLGQSVLTANGGAGNGTSFAGGNGGAISVTSNLGGMTGIRGTIGNLGSIRANGGSASASGNAAGGKGGTVTLTNAAGSTGAIVLTSQLEAKNGGSIGNTAALDVGSVNVYNLATPATATTLGSIYTDGGGTVSPFIGNHSGHVNISTTGSLSMGAISATGGTFLAATNLAGSRGGNVTISTGAAITALQSIFASGSAGVGANQAGGAGGFIRITTVGGFNQVNPPPLEANGGAGSATNGAGGAAGSITVENNSTGEIKLNGLTVRAGAAGGTAEGGAAGSIRVWNKASGGNVTLSTITTAGFANGHGGAVDLTTTGTGTLSVGNISTFGGTVIDGSTLAGRDAGDVTISTGAAITALALGTITASGSAGKGANQAGGAGGVVSITTGGGIAGNAAITVSGGNGSATNGAGGAAGTITVVNNSTTAGVIALGALTANAGTKAGSGAAGTAGSISVRSEVSGSNGGSFTVNNNITATNGTVSIDAGTGTYTQNNFDIDAGTGNITVVADKVVIVDNTNNNAFKTTGTLTLKPKTLGRAMSLVSSADATVFALSTAEITAISGGANSIVIGDAASTGVLNIGGAVTITGTGKSLTLNAGSITDSASSTTTTVETVNLKANANANDGTIGSAGNPINIAATNLSVNTNNASAFVSTGAVTMSAGPDGNGSNLGAGTLDLTASGAVSQTGKITANTLNVKTRVDLGAAINLSNAGNDVDYVNLQTLNATGGTTVGAAISYTDADGFDITGINNDKSGNFGNVTLIAGGTVTQSREVNAAQLTATLTGESSALILGTVIYDNVARFENKIAQLNAIDAPGGFSLTNGDNSVTVAGNITATGTNSAVSIDVGTGIYTQNNVDIDAGAGNITVVADKVAIADNTNNNAFKTTTGTLTLKPKTLGRAMSLAGSLATDPADVFYLSAAEITAFSGENGATNSIVIGDAASTGQLTIGGAVSLTGKSLTLNAGSMTDSGVQTITATNVTLNANGQIGTSNSNGIDIAATNLSVFTSGDANAFVRTGTINMGVGTSGSSVGGTLDLTATGTVTQTVTTGNITAGTLNVKTLAAGGAGAITLTHAGNDAAFVNLQALNGDGTANAPAAISYTNATGFEITGINNGNGSNFGTVTLAAGGAVTQTGAVNAAQLSANLSAGALNLNEVVNNIAQLNAITAPGGFTLNNGDNALAINGAITNTNSNSAIFISTGIGAITFSGSGSIVSNGGNVTLTNSHASKVLGNINTAGEAGAGDFTITGEGVISQLGSTTLTIQGTTTLEAGAGNNITLGNVGNDFNGAVSVTSGNNVTLRDDTGTLTLGLSTIAETLTINAVGDVTQEDAVNAKQLTAYLSAGALNLNGDGNKIDQLNAISTPGGFTLNNGDNALAINGAITITNAENAVSISTGSSETTFGANGSIASGGGNVTLTNSHASKVLGNINTAGEAGAGDFTITGEGVISQLESTTLTIRGTTSIAAGAGNDVTLDNLNQSGNPLNDFGGAVSVSSGKNVKIRDKNGLTLGTSTVLGTLTLNAGGTVTQTGAVNAAELSATLTGTNSALNLGVLNNKIDKLNAISTTSSFSLTNGTNSVSLNGNITASATSSVVLIEAGSITDTGNQTITARTVNLRANGAIGSDTNGIELLPVSNSTPINLSVYTSNANGNADGNADAFVSATGAINMAGGPDGNGSSVSGTLDLTATGAVTQGNKIIAVTLNVETNAAITLANPANNAATVNLQALNGAAISYRDADAVIISGINSDISGTAADVTLVAGGAVTQSGLIKANGLALSGTGGAYTLDHENNAVTTLAANTGSVNYKQSGALVVGTVGTVSGVTTTGTAQIETTGIDANLTLSNAVTSGATGNAIILKAGSDNAAEESSGGQLINSVGTGGIVLTSDSGRYLVYSGDPGSTTEGVTGYAKRYNAGKNYVVSEVTASTFFYRIAPILTVTANPGNKVYDGLAPTLTYTTDETKFIDGDTSGTALTGKLTRTGGKNVGENEVLQGELVGLMGYRISYTGANYSINKKVITLSGITAANKTYDGNTTAAVSTTNAAFNNMVTGDDLTVSSTGSFASKTAAEGKTVTLVNTLGGADLANYTITDQTSTTANIDKRAITLSGITAANKTYDGGTTATVSVDTAVFNDKVTDDVLTVSSTGSYASKTAAEGKTVTLVNTLGGADLANYTITEQTTTTANIDKRAITLSGITAANKTYDGNTTATVSVDTAVFNDKVTDDVLTVSSTGSFATKTAAEGKTVNLVNTLGGADLANYTITEQTTTTANIDKKAITLSGITAANKTYDGGTTATVSVDTAVFNDKVTDDVLTVSSTGSFATKTAAEGKTVTLVNTLGGADLANYTITEQTTATANIDKKAITLSGITAANKTYDGNTTATVSVDTAVFNDKVTDDVLTVSSTGSYATKTAAEGKTVTLVNTLGGADLANYTITEQTTTTANIDKRAITLSGITAANKTYDGNTTATVSVDTAVFNDKVTDDVLTVSSTGSFATKTAAEGKTVTLVNTLGGADLANYTITEQTTATANIEKASATVNATATNTSYSGATQSQTGASTNGFITGDKITVSGLAAGTDAGTYVSNLTVSGEDLINYNINITNANLVIAKAILTYAADNSSFSVGTTPTPLSGTVSGFVNNESQSTATSGALTWTTPATSESSAGNYAIDGSGLNANNYSFSQAAGNATALTLTPAPAPAQSVSSVPPAPVVNAPPLPSNTSSASSAQLARNTPLFSLVFDIDTLFPTGARRVGNIVNNATQSTAPSATLVPTAPVVSDESLNERLTGSGSGAGGSAGGNSTNRFSSSTPGAQPGNESREANSQAQEELIAPALN